MSDAVVERIFSHMTYVQIKQMKRISVKILKALFRICTHLHIDEEDEEDASITATNIFWTIQIS